MRTRIFLRTSEFLWQEGHTVHATEAEARDRTRMMLDVYARFAEEYLAMPVVKGAKTPSERFPGAVDTLCIEAMMQDRKALQAGTSHFLGQNFAKASGIRFQTAEETEAYAWTTSWGSSTRMIGGLIMTHSDDDGLIMPPRVASAHVVLLPIWRKEAEKAMVLEYVDRLSRDLRDQTYHGRSLRVEIDQRDIGGARGWEWIKKGIPVRVEIGPRDIQKNAVFVGRRDRSPKEKETIDREAFVAGISRLLDQIQSHLYDTALAFRESHTVAIDRKDDFMAFFTPASTEKPEIHGGFSASHWCGSDECEAKIKEDLVVTIRCIPMDEIEEGGYCIWCNQPSNRRVVFAKAY
jgi:prolyl-tRNA synthetase